MKMPKIYCNRHLFYLIVFSAAFTIAYFILKGEKWTNAVKRSIFKLEDITGYAISSDEDDIVVFPCKVRRPEKGDILHNNSIWQKPINSEIYLFSAFYDSRMHLDFQDPHYIRILGMSKEPISQSYYCQLWHSRSSSLAVEAEFTEIWFYNWDKALEGKYYKPYLISCPVPFKVSSSGRIPKGVSLVSSTPCSESTVYYPLKPPPQPENEKKDFVICVKGMDFENDISLKLIEWLELHFILGASEVVIYVFHVHPTIAGVLQYYQSLGKVQVKFLTLPGTEPNSPQDRAKLLRENKWLKRRHELIPYNDCFYDHIYTHRFVVLLDLDEAIVPVLHNTWGELVNHILTNYPNTLKKYASLSVQNVYFFDEFGASQDFNIPTYMHMTRHVYRSANFSHPGFAVKSFLSTNTTLAAFNHYSLMTLYYDVQKYILLKTSLVQLHHYRESCPPLMASDCQTNFMKFRKKDTILWKYKDILISNVQKVIDNLNLKKSIE